MSIFIFQIFLLKLDVFHVFSLIFEAFWHIICTAFQRLGFASSLLNPFIKMLIKSLWLLFEGADILWDAWIVDLLLVKWFHFLVNRFKHLISLFFFFIHLFLDVIYLCELLTVTNPFRQILLKVNQFSFQVWQTFWCYLINFSDYSNLSLQLFYIHKLNYKNYPHGKNISWF